MSGNGHDWNAAILRWVHDLASLGVLITDTDLVIRGWNRWLEIHTGWPAETIVGRRLPDVYPELEARGLDRYYEQALAGQVQVLAQRFHRYFLPMPPSIADSDLAYMPQSVQIASLLEAGQVIGTITLIEDVTERMVREAELRTANDQLKERYQEAQQAVKARDQFVSIAAHELKTPLTAMLTAGQLLQRRLARVEGLDARNIRTAEVLVQQVSRLNQMVAALLDLSRIESGQLSLDRRPLDLCPLVRQIAAEVQTTLESDIHHLTVQIPDSPVAVVGDTLRLEQVLQNLLQNAIKYSPAGGSIVLAVGQEAGDAYVRVTDQGIGIPADALAHLFDRFYRAANVDALAISGLGIGLHVVQQIVALHGGEIDVVSHEGSGSTFTVRLPLAPAPPL